MCILKGQLRKLDKEIANSKKQHGMEAKPTKHKIDKRRELQEGDLDQLEWQIYSVKRYISKRVGGDVSNGLPLIQKIRSARYSNRGSNPAVCTLIMLCAHNNGVPSLAARSARYVL